MEQFEKHSIESIATFPPSNFFAACTECTIRYGISDDLSPPKELVIIALRERKGEEVVSRLLPCYDVDALASVSVAVR